LADTERATATTARRSRSLRSVAVIFQPGGPYHPSNPAELPDFDVPFEPVCQPQSRIRPLRPQLFSLPTTQRHPTYCCFSAHLRPRHRRVYNPRPRPEPACCTHACVYPSHLAPTAPPPCRTIPGSNTTTATAARHPSSNMARLLPRAIRRPSRATVLREWHLNWVAWDAWALTVTRPPQQGYGQPQYNNYGGQYGQPTPPPQQYGYGQVGRWEFGGSE
jgi:hypothetical protein